MKKYDLVVIGAGPGGTPAAIAAATFGKKVLLIDSRGAPGGECLFEGCIPSKVLENAANRYAMLKDAKRFHVDMKAGAQIHWDEVLKDKDEIIEKRSKAALHQISTMPTLEFMGGKAKFVDDHTIAVGSESFSFDKALIATGGKVNLPPFKGNGVKKAWTNRDIFFEKNIPKEVVFVGAGAISCELAQMLNKLGTKCHILERSDRILKRIDADAALLVQQRMEESGITIDLNVNMGEIEYGEERFSVTFSQNGEKKSIQTPHLLLATGRIANVDDIGLENIGVNYDRHGIIVNDRLQTAKSHIYACGDCINAPRFAHTASYEAGIVVHNMFAPNPHTVDYDKNSWVLFSDPQITSVGLDEQSAAKRGMDVMVEKYDYSIDARAQIDKEVFGFLKFVIEKSNGQIIGVQIANEDASSLAGEAALIVANKLKATDVLGAIHPHPTLTESFGFLSRNIFFKMMMGAR